MINSFTLATPMFDPVGLALHPLPALCNHSCEYNAVIRFGVGGRFLQVIPIRDIQKDEEVLISYIDTTHPYVNRQRELRERYFFDCKCPKCLKGPTTPADEFLTSSAPDLGGLLAIEERVVGLIQSAEEDTSITGPIQKLKYGLHLLEQTKVWPRIRYPTPELVQHLIVANINAQQYNLAMAYSAGLCFQIDKILMPQGHHPVRMVHLWVLIRLIDYIMDAKDWAGQKLDLKPYSLNLGFLLSYVIRQLKRFVDRGLYTAFAVMVGDKHHQIRGRYAQDESELTNNKKIRVEFAKLTRLTEDVFDSSAAWDGVT